MDELPRQDAGVGSSLTQLTTGPSVHVHRDGHDGLSEAGASLAVGRVAECLLADVSQNLCDNFARFARGSRNVYRMAAAEQLRAGVRALAPHDQPGSRRPGRELDAVGDLRDLPVLALAAILVERRNPRALVDLEDRGTDRRGQLVAEREAHVRCAAVVGELVRRARGVRAHEDLDRLDLRGRDLLQRPVKHRHVIGRGICAGVPGPQQRAERLACLIGVGVQRVKPVAALPVAGRALLLRMAGDQRRVDVDRELLRRAVQLPEPLARPGVRRAQRVHKRGVRRDPVDHPKRRGVRRDCAEQRLLVAHGTEIGNALTAVGEHHRQIADHAARIMATTPLLDRDKAQRQRPRGPQPVGDARQQRGARVRHEPHSVHRDFYGYRASITHHPQGEPPSSGSRTFSKPKNPGPTGRFRAPARRGRGHQRIATARSGLGTNRSRSKGVFVVDRLHDPVQPQRHCLLADQFELLDVAR
jgi:hypothetical protein